MVKIAMNEPADNSCLHGKLPDELLRRRTDTRPVPPASPVVYREALARGLDNISVDRDSRDAERLTLAADKLRRDEQNNAEMIDVLVRAGYNDIPAQIDASVIRRLIDYITPR
jgi:hypothetical protein